MNGLLPGKEQSPEEKAEVQRFVTNAKMVIHSPETRDAIVERLKAGDPVEAISETAILVIDKMENDAKAQKTQVSDNAKLMGAYPMVVEIAGVGEAAGIFQLTDEQKTQAFSKSYSKYINREIAAGRINKDELVQASLKAKEQGNIDLGPKLNQAADQLKQGAPQQQVQPQGQQAPPQPQGVLNGQVR